MMGRQFAITVDNSPVVRRIDYSVTAASSSDVCEFDAADDLAYMMSDAFAHSQEPEHLRYEAAHAIQRIKGRSAETTEDWATEVAKTFFADLEEHSQ